MFTLNEGKFYPATKRTKEDVYVDKLKPGLYEFEREMGFFSSTPVFKPYPFREGLIEINGEPFTGIKAKIDTFFSERTRTIYKDIKINHFLGSILYGPPGTGKTCLVETVCQYLVATKNAVILRMNNHLTFNMLHHVIDLARANDDNIMVVVIVEEMDKVMKNQGWGTSEKSLIDFCDGSFTPNNVLVLANTNNINALPDTLTSRPSRFAVVEEIKYMPEAALKDIVAKFLPGDYAKKVNINEVMHFSMEKLLTVDQIKNVCLKCLIYEMSVPDAVESVIKEWEAVLQEEDDDN